MNHRQRMLTGFSLASCMLLAACELPPPQTKQQGFRGTGMVAVTNKHAGPGLEQANRVPEPEAAPAAGSPLASTVYQNVPELGHLSLTEFTRLMVAITKWVAPEQGCAYCHEGTNFASDAVYTKVVSRRMLQMTREINAQWGSHVGQTGVTCYTCHRGNPVPAEIWFAASPRRQAAGLTARNGTQNSPSPVVGLTSLPHDPFATYLSQQPRTIRVVAKEALPHAGGATIDTTEQTYGLMMHLSKALGVNCTHCHNSRSFAAWDQGSPARVTAWHGLHMVSKLNTEFLEPLKPHFPPQRLGAQGDAPKVNCATCHQGAPKPLLGAAMVKDYPELLSKATAPASPPPAADAATPTGAAPAADRPADQPSR